MKHILLLASALALSPTVFAKEACESFKWDVAHEHSLHQGTAQALTAGRDAASAPKLQLDTLYALTLTPQEQVKLAVPPSKKMLDDGAYAGVIRFHSAQAGLYRVSVNAGFWLDVVSQGKLLPSVDFNGSPGCDTPRKIVVYQLPADADLLLQFSAATDPQLRVTLTPVTTAAP